MLFGRCWSSLLGGGWFFGIETDWLEETRAVKDLPVFIISLQKAVERRELMTRYMELIAMPFEWVDAVETSAVTPNMLEQPAPPLLKKSEIWSISGKIAARSMKKHGGKIYSLFSFAYESVADHQRAQIR